MVLMLLHHTLQKYYYRYNIYLFSGQKYTKIKVFRKKNTNIIGEFVLLSYFVFIIVLILFINNIVKI